MKSILLMASLASSLFFSACSKSDDATPVTPPPPVNNTFDPATATLLKQGSFSGNMGYSVSGTVKLLEFQGKKYIHFENFSSSNGPDLKVYIATSNTAAQFVSLGSLRGVTGVQTYEVVNPPNFTQYNKILIWCQQAGALFGSSTIQ